MIVECRNFLDCLVDSEKHPLKIVICEEGTSFMSRKSYRARLVVAKNRSGAPTAARRLVRLDLVKQKIRVGVARSCSETGLHSNFSLLFSLDCIKYSSTALNTLVITY